MKMESVYSRFRQKEEVVAHRQRKYLRYFQKGGLILDVGCGRGEFLEILKQNHIKAEGVDSDPAMIEVCHKKNLKAFHSSAMEYLSDKKEVYDGIFASHVLEHMSGDSVVEFLKRCHRSLKPRGKLVVITPNPENLQVLTCTFWLDLTHRRPYPLMLLKALLEESGFRIEDSGEDSDTRSAGFKRRMAGFWVKYAISAKLARALYGAQDIFVVGEK
jgi:2-polyprenyl-3-methyl-5-hydroxy-6-metoxy-1,4-benzoquinol methylase